jgi:retron-type reverse transcriptase
VDNIATGLANFKYLNSIIHNNGAKIVRLKLPLYQNLTNPCFLFAVYFKIENNKSEKICDILCGSTILASLASLALAFSRKKYLPKPKKRIFTLKADGKMSPLGVVSAQDSIVQEVLKVFLVLRFESVFKDSSYGFRPKRNCHSALKFIHSY